MPTFIDESGDTGWHDRSPQRRSATHFRLAAVWLPTPADADACRAAIRGLWHSIPLPDSVTEFHYVASGNRPEWRAAFFRTVLEHPFKFVVASLDKRPLWRDRPHRRVLFNLCVFSLAATLRPHYADAESRVPPRPKDRGSRLNEVVVVDDNEDPVLLEAIREAFMPLGTYHCGTRTPKPFVGPKPWFEDSEQDELLQLADMVCGAVCDSLAGDDQWCKLIRGRQLGVNEV